MGLREWCRDMRLLSIDDKPQITLKMYQRDPHRVCASVKLGYNGIAVGYFIEEDMYPNDMHGGFRPGFAKEIGRELYDLLISNLDRLRPVEAESPNEDDRRWFAIILSTQPIRVTRSISFSSRIRQLRQ